jgi:hypothetical protein
METAHSEKRKNSKVIRQTPGCTQDKAMVPEVEITPIVSRSCQS